MNLTRTEMANEAGVIEEEVAYSAPNEAMMPYRKM